MVAQVNSEARPQRRVSFCLILRLALRGRILALFELFNLLVVVYDTLSLVLGPTVLVQAVLRSLGEDAELILAEGAVEHVLDVIAIGSSHGLLEASVHRSQEPVADELKVFEVHVISSKLLLASDARAKN